MAKSTSANLTDRVSTILQDSGNTWFSDADISSQLQDCLSELSLVRPRITKRQRMAISASKLGKTLSRTQRGREIDLSDLDKLLWVDRVEYPIGYSSPVFRTFELYGSTLYLDIDRPVAGEQNDTRGESQLLTGTVTFTDSSTAVSGSGTAFTSELEVGYYISKSGSSNWYRIASITDDTNLVLATNCATADTGVDTADKTRYWYEYINIWCAEKHYVEATQTDFAGAVKTAHSEGCWQLTVDALGTGSMPKGMEFTIAGVEGIYIIKENATITTNEATLTFEPRLKGIAPDNAVVTFYPSSLNPAQENVLCELTAARVALNFVPDARTALDNAVTAYGLANTENDKIAAIAAQINTDAGTARTAASANFSNATTAIGKAETSLNTDAEAALDKMNGDIEIGLGADGATLLGIIDAANTQIDSAITDTTAMKTAFTDQITGNDTLLTAMGTAITQAGTYTGSGDDYINTIPIGNLPENAYLNYAGRELGKVTSQYNKMRASYEEAKMYDPIITNTLQNAQGFLSEVSARAGVEGQLTAESLQEARDRIRLAYGSLAEAREYINADAQKVSGLLRGVQAQSSAISGYVNASNGYFREATASLNLANAVFNNTLKWANLKLGIAMGMLKDLGTRVRVRHATV